MDKGYKLLIACVIALAFLTGILASFALDSVYIDKESPFLLGIGGSKAQPGNWVSENKIEVLKDRVIIHIPDAELSRYADTGSMLPTFGEDGNGIKIVPTSANQIKMGDIISFSQGDKLIVHRVVDKGQDNQGDWFVTKGDNNQETDGKVYWKDVKYVTVAVIY